MQIRVDKANEKLRVISPVIGAHGVEYEKAQFQKKLDEGRITLERTKKWLRDTIAVLRTTSNSVVDLSAFTVAAGGMLAKTYMSILASAWVDLIVDCPSELPETTMLDEKRIEALNVHFHRNVETATMLTYISQFVKDGKVLGSIATMLRKRAEKGSCMSLIDSVVERVREVAAEKDCMLLRNLIADNVVKTSDVYKCMVRQFKVITNLIANY